MSSVIGYAVYRTVAVDGSPAGTVVNRVLWDGVQAWEPGDGLAAVADPDGTYRIGSVYEASE
ncbi:hypothetical protein [Gluconobacter frateurii]|uniref:Uncharacterized protein n=1 Tax=Gluconobacter frateurii NRIC 0228 TaxID=1307946 RepID=A0ABQ0Q920_9PROT|nr:hypothetical protein [Gluconobacter frateurii]GBR09533.1 hypothetical protein AA0228_0709 [Gluconobacter frateurii NRIC 0228]GLP91928.1 hypothetical protein GCM10007868_30030 [Gluconobacter frateurii]